MSIIQLESKIKDGSAKVAVIGLGYVGLPNAVHYSKQGYSVNGIDSNPEKINLLNAGESYIVDISEEEIKEYLSTSGFSNDFELLAESDVIFIDVPTPIDNFNNPDVTYLESASGSILKHARKGQLIILESTTYPTSTVEFLVKPLEKLGFKVGTDIFVAFSPERIDPGNTKYHVGNTPRVVGGYTEVCTKLAAAIIGERAYSVSSIEVAEMSKLFENTFRFVNIALSDELAKLCSNLNISAFEVLESASTKPFGFMKFTPSSKIGGHCIAVDPFYLQWYMKGQGMDTPLINASSTIDRSMTSFVTKKILKVLSGEEVPLYNCKVALIGVSYKKNVPDIRMSGVPVLYNELKKYSIHVGVFDPYVEVIDIDGREVQVSNINYDEIGTYDIVVLLTAHDCIDYVKLADFSKRILDTEGVYIHATDHNIYCL